MKLARGTGDSQTSCLTSVCLQSLCLCSFTILHRVKASLAVILVGDRPDSSTYVRMKQQACEEVGIISTMVTRPESATEQELLDISTFS